MQWMESLEKMMAYVEKHLTQELTIQQLGCVADFSPFYLQRIFAMMTEMTLGEYVRKRKLSAAGQDLQSGAKVLDTALKYGWSSPESFEKAFWRFHGVTPSAARKPGTALRCLNPLHIQVTLTGGSVMDYQLEDMGQLTILGMERRFDYEDSFEKIPKYWEEYCAKGLMEVVCGCLGVCIDEPDKPDFAYLIAHFCDKDSPIPEGFVKRTFPAHTWAKFRSVGALPGALQTLNRQIFTQWLPTNSEWEMAESMNIEMYTEGDMASPDYVCEIWIPVKKKEQAGK